MTTTYATRHAPDAHPEPDDVVGRFLDALAAQRVDDLAGLLAPDVWLRALLTRSVVKSNDAAGARAAFDEWFGSAVELVPLELTHEAMPGVQGRLRLRYRFLLRPRWAADRWHVIEQTGYGRVRDGHISRLDLACTGFHPVDDPTAVLRQAPASATTTRS